MFRRQRKGAYAVLFSLLLVFALMFGAIAIDGSMVRLAQTQSQDIADAAAHAAVLALKRTGSRDEAETVAEAVVAANRVMGQAPAIEQLTFGDWDEGDRTFTESAGSGVNSVRVRLGRTGASALPLWLAPIMGFETASVEGTATAASRSLDVVLVLDITGSWHQKNFKKAREAALRFLEVLHANHGMEDRVGMVLFLNRYGWEFTPLTNVDDSSNNSSLVYDKWAALNVGSYAGDYQAAWATGANLNSKHVPCKVYGTTGTGAIPFSNQCSSGRTCYQPSYRDNFTHSSPTGGCFPTMPHYYSDEAGTDHTTGMNMAKTMFNEQSNPTVYRAMVVLTDGEPYGYTSSSLRTTANDTETRYREYKRSTSHSTSQITADTPVLAQAMYNDLNVNTWFVSFVEEGTFMENSAKGDGWFELAETADEIVPIFERIAHSLPAAVVE